jgi:outer membrane protein assembly factor BamB
VTRAWIALAATAFLLGGCETVGGAYDRMFGSSTKPVIPELAPIKQTVTMTVVWQAAVGAAEKNVFFPAIDRGVVYAAGRSGEIAGFEAETGKPVSQFAAEQTLSAGVGAGGGLIVVGTGQGEMLAFTDQGRPLWKARVLGELLAPPEIDEGMVVTRAGNNQIYGFSAADGKQRWLYQRTPPSLSVRSHAGVVLHRGGVFAGFAGGRLVGLTLSTGAVGWENVVALPRGTTELERVADVTSLPVIDRNQVCAVAFQGRVACFDLARGTQLWARDVSSVAGLSVDDRYLYVTDDKSAVLALDKAGGASIWRQDKLAGRVLTAPLGVGNHVVAGDIQGYVHVLARDTGALEGRLATDGSAIAAPPVELGRGRFVVQTTNGGLFAIAIQ